MLAGLETLPNKESWSWLPLENIIVSGRVRHSKSESMVTCIKLGSGNPWGEKNNPSESPRKSETRRKWLFQQVTGNKKSLHSFIRGFLQTSPSDIGLPCAKAFEKTQVGAEDIACWGTE